VSEGSSFPPSSHRLKHVDSLLGIALTDLFEGLVLVSALRNVLSVQDVVTGLLGLHFRSG